MRTRVGFFDHANDLKLTVRESISSKGSIRSVLNLQKLIKTLKCLTTRLGSGLIISRIEKSDTPMLVIIFELR